jgi:lipopolysaccharide/colanic/teichoic acid biosynthesis glycosyltransferase
MTPGPASKVIARAGIADAWRDVYRGHLKRALDLGIAFVLLLALCPLFLVVAVAVRFRLGRPVFFRQVRLGLHGAPFLLLKFRTMSEARDPNGQLLPDEQRLTALGRWLRQTSLDELPQLINVLQGQISLVGPRPLLPEYRDLYSPAQGRRHTITPGITGWAQVKGRNLLGWQERFSADLWYVEHYGLVLDLWILWLTLVIVLRQRGVSSKGFATMPKFAGNGT